MTIQTEVLGFCDPKQEWYTLNICDQENNVKVLDDCNSFCSLNVFHCHVQILRPQFSHRDIFLVLWCMEGLVFTMQNFSNEIFRLIFFTIVRIQPNQIYLTDHNWRKIRQKISTEKYRLAAETRLI